MTNKEIKKLTIKNLKLLRDHIRDKVTDEQFDMHKYRTDENRNIILFRSKDDCGTIGCALGWAPFVKGLEPIEEDFYNGNLDFNIYSERIFPAIETDDYDDKYYIAWAFIFNAEWKDYDNTREGFVKRVNYLIKKGLKAGDYFDLGYDSYEDFKEGWVA